MRRSALSVVTLAVVSLSASQLAAVEEVDWCHPPDTLCGGLGQVAGLGNIALALSSPDSSALAQVNGQNIVWLSFEMVQNHPTVGNLRVTLDPGRVSTGHLDLPTFPSSSTMNFFWKIESPVIGTLVSVNPAVLTGVANGIPPIGSVYTLQSPVGFHQVSDPTHQIVFTLLSAQARIPSRTGTAVPAARPVGLALLTALLLFSVVVMRFRTRVA